MPTSTPVNDNYSPTKWDLKLNRDYIDATTFGDTNKSYLMKGVPTKVMGKNGAIYINATGKKVPGTYEVRDDPPFDYKAARKMYEDDPVVLAIINRMLDMDNNVDF